MNNIPPNSLLLLVDLQNDFCEQGALAVPQARQIIPVANRLLQIFPLNAASKDWHPADHCSFAFNHPGRQVGDIVSINSNMQHLWPVHCIEKTMGAEFHPKLLSLLIQKIIYKGQDSAIDSYSVFYDNAQLRSTDLFDYLRFKKVKELFIMGLAAEFCVLHTVLDALHLGFKVSVIQDGIRGLGLATTISALKQMESAGAQLIFSEQLFEPTLEVVNA